MLFALSVLKHKGDKLFCILACSCGEAVTEAPKRTCDHLHSQEADDVFAGWGDLFEDPEEDYRQLRERCSNNRPVIAHGGLRLRDKPSVKTGKTVGLISDGEIVQVIDRTCSSEHFDISE